MPVHTQPSSDTDIFQARELLEENLVSSSAPCVTASFQAESVVLMDMLRRLRPGIPVLFIDTFHHFPETVAYRDQIVDRWGLNLVTLAAPEPARDLWRLDASQCCSRHKVEPLFSALESHDVWFTGLRRAQSPTRATLGHVESFRLPSGKLLRKVNPLAAWSKSDVWAYAREHDIPLLPLYEQGYTSIGCEPCTTRPLDPGNERSGRWAGQKLECGIHIQPVK